MRGERRNTALKYLRSVRERQSRRYDVLSIGLKHIDRRLGKRKSWEQTLCYKQKLHVNKVLKLGKWKEKGFVTVFKLGEEGVKVSRF